VNDYYVYTHVDPATNQVVYVGSGSDGRAWEYKSFERPNGGGGQRRNTHHAAYLRSLVSDRLTPDHWVRIVCSGLDLEAARRIEKVLIAELKPMFNNVKRARTGQDLVDARTDAVDVLLAANDNIPGARAAH
jgi:hypothetical protein